MVGRELVEVFQASLSSATTGSSSKMLKAVAGFHLTGFVAHHSLGLEQLQKLVTIAAWTYMDVPTYRHLCSLAAIHPISVMKCPLESADAVTLLCAEMICVHIYRKRERQIHSHAYIYIYI